MTPEKLKSVFAQYRAVLDQDYPGLEPEQMPESSTRESAKDMYWKDMAAHYKFMCDEAQRFVAMAEDEGNPDEVRAVNREKAMRWLGFLQGAFWRCGRFTLDELKNHSRPDNPEG